MSFTLLLCVDDEMIYRQQQDATAINLRMGSGGRLTSRRCHEITWPSCGRRARSLILYESSSRLSRLRCYYWGCNGKGNDFVGSAPRSSGFQFGIPGVLGGPTSARLLL